MASDEYKLRDGHTLTWRDNPEGIGRTYYVRRRPEEEPILVWNTSVLPATVLSAAIATEAHLQHLRQEENEHD